MKTDQELVAEAFEAVKTVVERWEAAGIPLSVLPQDVAGLFAVADRLLSARERLKSPQLQETIAAFNDRCTTLLEAREVGLQEAAQEDHPPR